MDLDGDGVARGADCDDRDPDVTAGTWYRDEDGDGYGVDDASPAACRPATDAYATQAGDCDDGAAGTHPNATETCDGLDEDCDGAADDGLAFTTWYEDEDGDGYGVAASEAACSQPLGFAASAGDCDDDQPGVNPSAVEVFEDGLDNDCDGVGASLPASMTFDDAAARLDGSSPERVRGSQLAGGGDLLGSGGEALVVGAQDDDGGLIYVYSGDDLEGRPSSPSAFATITAENPGDSLGATWGQAGDVRINEDSSPDLLAGAQGWTGDSFEPVMGCQESAPGSVYVFYGPLDPGVRSATGANRAVDGPPGGGNFGRSWASGGSVDGDTTNDLVVGASNEANDRVCKAGTAYVFKLPLGVHQNSVTDAWVQIRGTADSDSAGERVGLGDLDGDGLSEVVVAAPGARGFIGEVGIFGGADVPGEGAAYTMSEAAVLLVGSQDSSVTSASSFGQGVDAGADLDGDGLNDLVTSAPVRPGGGRVYIVHGAAVLPATLDDPSVSTLTGITNADAFGYSVMLPGDVTDDGLGDLLVGAPYDDAEGAPVYLFAGPITAAVSGPLDALSVIRPPEDPEDSEVLLAGRMDLNEDGVSDFGVAVPYANDGAGAVAIWFGGGF